MTRSARGIRWLAVIFALSMVIGHSGARAAPSPSTFQQFGLSGAIEHMCLHAGLQTIMVGEKHFADGTFEAIAQVLIGATRTGKWEFWRELNMDQQMWSTVDAYLANPPSKLAAANWMADAFMNHQTSGHPALKGYQAAMGANVTSKVMLFVDPSRRDMAAFLLRPGRRIGSAGCAHWEGFRRGDINSAAMVWKPNEVWVDSLYATHPEDARLDMHDGFRKAMFLKQRVIAVRASTVYDYRLKRADAIRGYLAQGVATFELPLVGRTNASIIVPQVLLPTLVSFIDSMPGRISKKTALYCAGLPGCPAWHDEL